MQRYLSQLIADMRQAALNLPAKPDYDIPPEAVGIEYVIEWENATEKPMQEWFGIAKESFPPSEKLSDGELKTMVDEIIKLWAAYNFYASLPENLPDRIAYKVLVDQFDKPVAWVSTGSHYIEFCDYEPDNCPFPEEYCMCNDFSEEPEIQCSDFISENAEEIAMLTAEIKEIENETESNFTPQKDMVRYVDQLLEDMHEIAIKTNSETIISDDLDTRGRESIRELVHNPFETLETHTGIGAAQLPNHIEMDGLQTRKLLSAMLELLDAFNLKVHFPKHAPHEIKYEVLRDEWDTLQVKHLLY
jgi:hypothetical protein